MNNSQIQKIIFICLTFPNVLISSGDVHSSYLVKSLIINKNSRFSNQNDYLESKPYNQNDLFANLKNTKNKISDISQIKSINKNINTSVNELLIESKLQSEKENILYADGDVVVKFKDNILRADSLTYNKKTKLAIAKGNIQLKINNQIFTADMVEYDFVKRKGNFKNIKGLINSESIISDFDFYSNSNYENLLSTIQRIKKDKIIFTSDKVSNWIFSAELLNVDQNKWSSKQAFLTNDLLETNQIKFQFNELQVYS